MSPEAWGALSLNEKFGWYYDYTHHAIEMEKCNFSRCLDVDTEALSDRTTLKELAMFVVQRDANVVPEAVHLNRYSYLNVDDFDEDSRSYAQWLFGTLSAREIARDPVYLSEYVSNSFIALTGYQITGFINEIAPAFAATPREISQSLDRFETLLLQRLKEVRLLKADLDRKLSEET